MINLNLTKDGIRINGEFVINKGENLPINLLENLGSLRVIPLDNGSTLYISDRLGLRFWTKDGIFTQLQIHLEIKENPLFPKNFFDGLLFINSQSISIPVKVEQLRKLKNASFSVDDDSKRFGVNIYELNLDDL